MKIEIYGKFAEIRDKKMQSVSYLDSFYTTSQVSDGARRARQRLTVIDGQLITEDMGGSVKTVLYCEPEGKVIVSYCENIM